MGRGLWSELSKIKIQYLRMQTIVIQGLGFVGAAMAVATASATDADKKPLFNVIGVDLNNSAGLDRINKLNKGLFPFETSDISIIEQTKISVLRGNLSATTNNSIYKEADIVLVSVNLDITHSETDKPSINLEPFKNAILTIGNCIKEETLIIVETTVPPGTCEKIVKPIIHECLKSRKLNPEKVYIAHSYERVMPGAEYLNSIINYWRVYSGTTIKAAQKCETFLSHIINTKDYPLIRLESTTASETAKVLENSYRAVNIAFIEEWGRFAEEVGFDLFSVIDAIRKRPTHSNIRQPGFGVGGYCLTKDPLFAKIAAKELFNINGLDFPFSTQAVDVNKKMPLVSLDKLLYYFDGSLTGIKILLMGVSYREDIGDTRFSPSELFYKFAKQKGADIVLHDPLVD
ncbi:MAG: nucleotide sugar dehydrogenase, partial [Bacteroidales bacterium]|nr:nucleotide sugar dehydrogenase [Bacteroidales bacterium]